MTPSAYRLLGIIQHRSASDSVDWLSLSIVDLAASLKLSERTLRRAKAELDGYGLVKFRTVSTGEGRGHKLHACLPSKLVGKRGELLHQSSNGKIRIARTKVGGRVIHKPRLKRRPHDTTNTIGLRSKHQDNKTLTVKRTLGSKPSKKQIALAHWLKRELWERHSWDNCKVMRSDAHAFGFALRAIQSGFDIDAIHAAFESALKTMHGTATDVGLSSGSPTQTLYCLSSTVSLAQRKLSERDHARFKFNRNTRPKSSRHHRHIHQEKDAPSYHMPPDRTQERRSTAPASSQVTRFSDIMSALA
jgi:hypothetical protein